MIYEGEKLSEETKKILYNIIRASNHPLSRQLYDTLSEKEIIKLESFEEVTGRGIEASFKDTKIKVGSSKFISHNEEVNDLQTSVYLQINDQYKGKFVFKNTYRKGVEEVFEKLKINSNLVILSGDNEGERERLESLLPEGTELLFQQNPQQKLDFVKKLQNKGDSVLMIGDGLNDAGALAQSDVGIVVSENINVFSPACDGILDATQFSVIPDYMKASKKSLKIIKWSFVFSFLYNITGLYFAVTAKLMPVIAAILMPLSSISIVVFTTIATGYIGRVLKKS